MFRKQGKISKELYQPLSRQNGGISHSKYTIWNLIQLKPSFHSLSVSSSEHIYYKNSVSSYHSFISNKNHHRDSCNCCLCKTNKSKFHSSSHLHQQEQLQQEPETTIVVEQKQEQEDPRLNVIQNTEETKNEKIDFIVNEIAKLNLLEVAQLVSSLKTKLNLPDTAMMGGPMMAAPAATAPAAGATDAGEAEPEITQTIFDIVLKGYSQEKKVSIIKEVRGIYKLGLKEAKALVEKAPCTLQVQAPKVEADEVKEKLEAIGAEIVLE